MSLIWIFIVNTCLCITYFQDILKNNFTILTLKFFKIKNEWMPKNIYEIKKYLCKPSIWM